MTWLQILKLCRKMFIASKSKASNLRIIPRPLILKLKLVRLQRDVSVKDREKGRDKEMRKKISKTKIKLQWVLLILAPEPQM